MDPRETRVGARQAAPAEELRIRQGQGEGQMGRKPVSEAKTGGDSAFSIPAEITGWRADPRARNSGRSGYCRLGAKFLLPRETSGIFIFF